MADTPSLPPERAAADASDSGPASGLGSGLDGGSGAGGPLAPQPLYAQVRARLVERLIAGRWAPGATLPSEQQLAAEFGVSQGTVRKALDTLAAENLLVRRQGRGTFVAEHDDDRALFHFFHMVGEDGSRRLPDSRVLSRRYGKAGASEAERLRLAPGAPVARFRRVRTLRGEPSIVESLIVPLALFPDIGREGPLPNTVYDLYARRYGITIARADECLRAVAADADDAALLEIAVGTPLLEIDRIAYALDGRPAEWRRSRCETRNHHYFVELV